MGMFYILVFLVVRVQLHTVSFATRLCLYLVHVDSGASLTAIWIKLGTMQVAFLERSFILYKWTELFLQLLFTCYVGTE